VDDIPFEKVTVQEAKAAADGPPAKPAAENWAKSRKKDDGQEIAEISEQAWAWIEQLPAEIQPACLVQQFPRITNKLAQIWKQPMECERYLGALVMDNRGGRQGFPGEITAELAKLQTHYVNNVLKVRFDHWGNRID
jgi:hypothetical protein